MSDQLFVSNLDFNVDEPELRELFATFGAIRRCVIVTEKQGARAGLSRGFAFVSFADPQAAQDALGLDGVALRGRPLRVRVAEDRR